MRTLRKRIAPVALMAALALLAVRTCSGEAAQAELVVDLGEHAGQVQAVRVDVFRQGEDTGVLVFERTYGEHGAAAMPRFEAQLVPGTYALQIEVRMPGRTARFERTVEVRDQAVIRVNAERELTSG